MIDAGGTCMTCKTSILTHPTLRCPWCGTVGWAAEARKLSLDPATSPAEVIEGCRGRLAQLDAEKRSVKALRAAAAREIMARDDRDEIIARLFKRQGHLIGQWATERTAAACRRGHARSEFGYKRSQRPYARWGCRECDRLDNPADVRHLAETTGKGLKWARCQIRERPDPEVPNLLGPLPLVPGAHEPPSA